MTKKDMNAFHCVINGFGRGFFTTRYRFIDVVEELERLLEFLTVRFYRPFRQKNLVDAVMIAVKIFFIDTDMNVEEVLQVLLHLRDLFQQLTTQCNHHHFRVDDFLETVEISMDQRFDHVVYENSPTFPLLREHSHEREKSCSYHSIWHLSPLIYRHSLL